MRSLPTVGETEVGLIDARRRSRSSSRARSSDRLDRAPGTRTTAVRPTAVARAPRSLSRRSHDRARLDDRERRPTVDPSRPRFHRDLARLGRERLSAHLRRLPSPRRPARRPLRPPPPLPDRPHDLHPRLARLRPGDLAGVPHRGAGGAGLRRRDRLGGRALVDHDPLHRACRAREGDGHRRLRALRRGDRRRASRRRPHRRALLALDLPRQHPRGRGGLRALPRAASGRSGPGSRPAPRHRGRGHGDGVAHARRLRDRERERGRLDVGPRRSGCSPPRRRSWRSSSSSRRGSARRSCRSASSGCATSRRRTPSAS